MYANFTVTFNTDGPRFIAYITDEEKKEVNVLYDAEATALLKILNGEIKYQTIGATGFMKTYPSKLFT